MRRTGAAALAIGLLLLAGVGSAVVAQRRLDPEQIRRAVIASVERQSGRAMTLGRLDVRLLPSPHVSADALTLGDKPGAADPAMLRIGHMSAGIGIWPLLRHVVRLDGLTLDHVVLHVVRDADGHGNWEMAPKPAASFGGSGNSRGGARWGVVFDTLRIDAAQISLRDGLMHRSADLDLARLAGSGLQGEQPRFNLAGERADAGYTVDGNMGPIRRLFDGSDRRTAWPISAQASETVAGPVVAHGQAAGSFTDPSRGRGYDLTVTLASAQLADLNRLFPHAGLPEMQGLSASGQVVDEGHPAVAALQAKAGLTAITGRPGLVVEGWSLAAPARAAPLDVAASGSWKGQPLVLKGRVASLDVVDAMLAAPAGQATTASVPVHLDLGLGKTAWSVEGTAGRGHSDLRVRGSVPDMRALVAGAPDLGQVTLGARLQADHAISFELSDLHLASAAGDLNGALTLSLQGRPTLAGRLVSARVDVNRLARRDPAPAPAVAKVAPGAPPPAATASPPAPPEPEAVLPWRALRIADADLSLQVADLLIGGQHYQGFNTHAILKDGRLLAEPFQATRPAGVIAARLQADATASPPTLNLWMHPVMLPAATLAKWLARQDDLRGTVELVGEMRASGEDRSALAGSASGHLGVSMTNGTVANASLLRLIGPSSAIAAALPAAGETAIRCLAMHAGIGAGQAAVDTLSLRTGRLSVDGHGRVTLADGALDLHLLPDAQVGGAWISLPMRLEGSLRDPHPALDNAAAGGRYALTIGSGGNGPGDCEAPLRLAREGVAGPAASTSVSGSVAGQDQGGVTGKHRKPKVVDILRGLGILR